MIGTLKDIVFETRAAKVHTWTALTISGPSRWAKHDLHLSRPVREFLGPDLGTIQLALRLDVGLGLTPRVEIAKLREYRDKGEVLDLILGDELIGDYVITSLSEDWARVDNHGNLLLAIVDVSLEEYA